MRRLLSSIGHRHLPSAGAHACRHICSPRRFFGFSPLCPIHGAGALPQFRPSPSFPLFDGGER
jgi:hypothetical protein